MNSNEKLDYRVVFSKKYNNYVVRDPSGNIIYMGEVERCKKYVKMVIEYLKSPFT